MPEGRAAPYIPPPEDRLRETADMLGALACLIGQANDIDLCGRDGLASLLDLLAVRIDDAARELSLQPSG